LRIILGKGFHDLHQVTCAAVLVVAGTNAYFGYATLTDADFHNATLTNPIMFEATLIGADFTGADVRGAIFFDSTTHGFTLAQLYSTASYEARDLSGIDLGSNNLAGANLAGQNLANASFSGATLTGADFTDAEILGASFGRYPFAYGGTGITLPSSTPPLATRAST
jgi:uncharacterized protein YjbI with pentapeptide repeats